MLHTLSAYMYIFLIIYGLLFVKDNTLSQASTLGHMFFLIRFQMKNELECLAGELLFSYFQLFIYCIYMLNFWQCTQLPA